MTREPRPKCEICGEPMPAGEEMFKFHGYSGPCPDTTLKQSSIRKQNRVYKVTPEQAEWAVELLKEADDCFKEHGHAGREGDVWAGEVAELLREIIENE